MLKEVLQDLSKHNRLSSYTYKCKIGPKEPTGCTIAHATVKPLECEDNPQLHIFSSIVVMKNAPSTNGQSAPR